MLIELEVDGLRGSIEFKSVRAFVSGTGTRLRTHTFDSYVARITWGEKYTSDGYLANWQSVAKSFGSGTRAEDWLLDQLENPSFFILQNT